MRVEARPRNPPAPSALTPTPLRASLRDFRFRSRTCRANFILTLSCADRPGIVAAVTTELAALDANIAESNQFWDKETGTLLHAAGLHRARRRGSRRAGACAEAGDRALRHAHDAGRPGQQEEAAGDGLASSTTPCCTCSTRSGSAGSMPRWRRSSPTTRTAARTADYEGIPYPPAAGRQGQQGGAGGAGDRAVQGDRRRSGGAGALHADPAATSSRPGSTGRSSTSTTRSCPASRAPSPITRRMSAASRSSAPRRTT